MPEKTITPSPKALDLARRLKLDPASRVFYELAREHHALGNLEEAARLCREGLQRHPAYHSARVLFGRVLIDMGLFSDARPELERVVKQAPDNLLARRLLAEALAGSGDRAGARAALRQLLAAQPGDAEALKVMAELESRPDADESAGLETLPRPEPEAADDNEAAAAEEIVGSARARGTDEPTATMDPAAVSAALSAARDSDLSRAIASTVMRVPLEAVGSTVMMAASEAARATVMMTPPEAVASTVMLESPEVDDRAREEESLGATVEMAMPAPRDVRTTIMSPSEVAARMEALAPEPPPEPDFSAATVMMRAPSFAAPEPFPAPEPGFDVFTTPVPAAAGAAGPPEPSAAGDGREPSPDDELTGGALPTPTLAEIYLAQGMPERALEVYEAVLAGDPHNHEAMVRIGELRERLSPQGSVTQRKIRVLEGWLGRIRRLKDVQDDAGRSGPTSAGV
ncbi:MAG TPA: tetratricopeptide repeat protein [Verrucomicrobiae bacterium]|nr:tetratricopeptide repeat protein [Verrucomicrobiae bacterium]